MESGRRRRDLERRGIQRKKEDSSFGKEVLEVGLEIAAGVGYCLVLLIDLFAVAIILIFAIAWVVCSIICDVC